MNRLLLTFLIFNLSCSDPEVIESQHAQTKTDTLLTTESLVTTEFNYTFPVFKTYVLKPPYYLSNDENCISETDVAPPVLNAFKTRLKTYYHANFGDPFETYFTLKDLYLHSYSIKIDAKTELYLLLLKSPTSFLTLEIICYNTISKTVFSNDIQTDLTWTFDEDNGKITRSNWFNTYAKNDPFIEITDVDKNGKKEIKINRIAHNGTAFTTLDEHYYEIADTTTLLVFSCSKTEYLSINNADITREITPTDAENTIILTVFILQNKRKTKIGTVIFKRKNWTLPYTQSEAILDKNLNAEQCADWNNLLTAGFSHEL